MPGDLADKTYRLLDTIPRIKRTNFVTPVLLAALIIAAVAFVGPRYATARTISSIQEAVEGKIAHIRRFSVDGNKLIFEGEMWTDGTRVREENPKKTEVSDGTRIVALDAKRRTATLYSGPPFRNKPSGFTVDAILSDMKKTQNLGSVELSHKTVNGRASIVADFADGYSHFLMLCDEKTRLPYRIEISDKKSKKRMLMEMAFIQDVNPEMFSITIPDGFKVIDVAKGYDDYAGTPLLSIGHQKAKFELYRADVDEQGNLYVLFGSDHLKSLSLEIKKPYAGPLKLENASSERRSLVLGRQAHVWIWSANFTENDTVRFNIAISGENVISQPIKLTKTNGEPGYVGQAIESSAHRSHMTSADLRAAISGQMKLPVENVEGLEIVATFDAVRSEVSGTVRNKTAKNVSGVALVYKLYNADGFFGASLVRFGDLPAGKTANFAQSVARVQRRQGVPVIKIAFDSLHDVTKTLSVSPE
jgi:outer membrane lipoprotein-sorting protein